MKKQIETKAIEKVEVGIRVQVVDPESPWAGRVGEVVAATREDIIVRFKGEFGFHDRYMLARQIERVVKEAF